MKHTADADIVCLTITRSFESYMMRSHSDSKVIHIIHIIHKSYPHYPHLLHFPHKTQKVLLYTQTYIKPHMGQKQKCNEINIFVTIKAKVITIEDRKSVV